MVLYFVPDNGCFSIFHQTTTTYQPTVVLLLGISKKNTDWVEVIHSIVRYKNNSCKWGNKKLSFGEQQKTAVVWGEIKNNRWLKRKKNSCSRSEIKQP